MEGYVHLLATEDQALLNGWDSLLLLNLLLDLGDLYALAGDLRKEMDGYVREKSCRSQCQPPCL